MYIQTRQYEKHLREARREVLVGRRVVVDALNQLLGPRIEIGPHDAGMHFVVWFSDLTFDELPAFLAKAAAVGLGVYPVHPYYQKSPPAPAC